jgi:hypothetical protein
MREVNNADNNWSITQSITLTERVLLKFTPSLTSTVWQVGTTHGRIVSRLQIPAHCDILDFTGSPMPAMGPQWLC